MTPIALILAAQNASSDYAILLGRLRRGEHRPQSEIDAVLNLAGKSYRDLVGALHAGDVSPAPGDHCQCGGRVAVTGTRRRNEFHVRYLGCKTCGQKYGKMTIPKTAMRQRRTSV